MSSFISLYEESLYLRGARDLMLRIQGYCDWAGNVKGKDIYNHAIENFLLSDRENMRRYLEGEVLYFYDHESNNKNKLIIDEFAAKIVKYIFELVCHDSIFYKICFKYNIVPGYNSG